MKSSMHIKTQLITLICKTSHICGRMDRQKFSSWHLTDHFTIIWHTSIRTTKNICRGRHAGQTRKLSVLALNTDTKEMKLIDGVLYGT
ncbi:hypothetical protein CDL12_03564 [Handroanthus impetiginosus]|uniref:Uncharacterized protein n=1 Tax=Handroanthus impetiginosus TaxID=429701 RepID=A0A2G9I1S9_9LAMI|nr:hypothetical protein CDL12_03564 [Handroanthus impetiginosus]